MKFVTWNVNGLRACMKKGFSDYFNEIDADFFAIQETKMQEEQKTFGYPGYFEYWSNAKKLGYSGTLIYTKHRPLNVILGIKGLYNDEGRVITLEYPDFYFVNAYVPNAQDELKRLDYRMQFEDDMRSYLLELEASKPIIYCGDLNVAHCEIDLTNPKSNELNPGYSLQERGKFSELLNAGFIDGFRWLYPEKVKYTWWSYRSNVEGRNIGWRIDYFIISPQLLNRVEDVEIHNEVYGSDHCPVVLKLK